MALRLYTFTVFSSFPIIVGDILQITTAAGIDQLVTDGELFVKRIVHGDRISDLPGYLLFTAPYKLCEGGCEDGENNFAMAFPIYVGKKGQETYKELYDRDYHKIHSAKPNAPFRKRSTKKMFTLCPSKITKEQTTVTPTETETIVTVTPTMTPIPDTETTVTGTPTTDKEATVTETPTMTPITYTETTVAETPTMISTKTETEETVTETQTLISTTETPTIGETPIIIPTTEEPIGDETLPPVYKTETPTDSDTSKIIPTTEALRVTEILTPETVTVAPKTEAPTVAPTITIPSLLKPKRTTNFKTPVMPETEANMETTQIPLFTETEMTETQDITFEDYTDTAGALDEENVETTYITNANGLRCPTRFCKNKPKVTPKLVILKDVKSLDMEQEKLDMRNAKSDKEYSDWMDSFYY